MTRPKLAQELYGLEWLDYADEQEGPDPHASARCPECKQVVSLRGWHKCHAEPLTIDNPGGGCIETPDPPKGWAGNVPEVRG